MPIARAAPTIARWLAAAVATLLASAAAGEDQYLRMATYAVGDKPADVTSYSDAVLTEYRFRSGAHSYALSRSLRGAVARDLVFIDDRLVCVLKTTRYSHWYSGGYIDSAGFWSDHDHWTAPVYKWEWANEPDGLEYLAAMLREGCGLESIPERRELQRDWGSRTMTGDEIAASAGEIGAQAAQFLLEIPFYALAHGYGPSEPMNRWTDFERRDRRDVEQRLWSLSLGLPQEELAAEIGVPDVQYTWRRTDTVVNAYHLGSLSRFFVGLSDGRVAWIHADYPGLIMQAKLAAQQQADTQK
jgi:hypothetical protein